MTLVIPGAFFQLVQVCFTYPVKYLNFYIMDWHRIRDIFGGHIASHEGLQCSSKMTPSFPECISLQLQQ